MRKSQSVVDYYRVLGVDKSADLAQIKRAYRRLALMHHPDRQGDETQIVLINEAYATLKDAKKRSKYDAIHALHFGVLSRFAKVEMLKENLQNFEQYAKRFSRISEQYWQNHGGSFFKNAQAIFAKFSHLAKQDKDSPERNQMAILPRLVISPEIALMGGEIYFSYRNQKVRTHLPAGLRHGTKIKLVIGQNSVWFLIQIQSE